MDEWTRSVNDMLCWLGGLLSAETLGAAEDRL
jgi:hypothetical protein